MTPTLRSVVVAAAGIGVAALPAVFGARLWTVWAATCALLAVAIAVDAALLPRRSSIACGAQSPSSLQIGERGVLDVEVSADGAYPPVRLWALAETDDLFERQPEIAAEQRGASAVVSIPLVPRRRGVGGIVAVWLRMRGPLGLIERRQRRAVGLTVAVHPDIRPVRSAALRAANRRETAAGSKTMRFIGEGSDFAALREFVPGHDHRAISWRASARHRQLLAREFHAERDQPVIVAVDTGHLMSEPVAGLARLDHAVNAALLLAWSCLKSGDRVGTYAFAAAPGPFRAPEAGLAAFAAIREWAAGLRYGTDETNTTLALTHLSTRLRRRSLIVVMTEFVDVVAARLMIENVGRLARRHLVLFVTLADPAPRRLAGAHPRSMLDVHRAVVAGQLLRERESVLGRLRRLGVHCIESEPGALPQDLVQRYLWIKRRELI